MTDLPTIAGARLVDACIVLGLTPADVRAVTMTLDRVTVQRYLHNENGKKYAVRRGWLRRWEVATTTDVYRVDWSTQ